MQRLTALILVAILLLLPHVSAFSFNGLFEWISPRPMASMSDAGTEHNMLQTHDTSATGFLRGDDDNVKPKCSCIFDIDGTLTIGVGSDPKVTTLACLPRLSTSSVLP